MPELFDLLSKFYGSRRVWEEVEKELRKENMSTKRFHDPFTNLVIGILSQNTSDRNSTRAYINLAKRFQITPKVLVEAPLREIKSAIRCGGMYNLKARRIKQLARIVLKKYGGDLKKLIKLPVGKVRKELLSFPGIGQKTTDVFIGYCMKKDSLPIDTNIKRVARRMGIVGKKAKYEEIQKALSKLTPKGKKLRTHELLIRLGRDFCKVRRPLCEKCPISSMCKKVIS
jgi:endonuclease-3